MDAVSTLAPAATTQRMRALAQANRVRSARASIKCELAAGRIAAAQVVRECPEEVESMTVAELLRSQRGWGQTRARKFLLSLALNENRELGNLTERQRRMLAKRLEG